MVLHLSVWEEGYKVHSLVLDRGIEVHVVRLISEANRTTFCYNDDPNRRALYSLVGTEGMIRRGWPT